jgi:hypothetical protein
MRGIEPTAEPTPADPKLAKFREALKDVGTALLYLREFCGTFEEAADLLALAMTNDAQARILLDGITRSRKT